MQRMSTNDTPPAGVIAQKAAPRGKYPQFGGTWTTGKPLWSTLAGARCRMAADCVSMGLD